MMALLLLNAKKYHEALCALIFFTACVNYCNAQTESTSGKDFWLGYGSHAYMYNQDGSVNTTGGSQEMRLYLSSSGSATVTVEIPGTGWSQTIQIQGGGINSDIVIPKTGPNDARLTGEGVFNSGIHISSNNPISAYCHIYAAGSSAASLLIPYEILGQDYYALGFTQASPNKNSFSWCFVVATEDSTLVEVTPSVNTQNHAAGVPFTQILQKGQILNLRGQLPVLAGNIYTGGDLTGTRIRTLSNGLGICRKISVFCGSSSTLISCSQTGTAENLFQQSLPYLALGQSYFAAPTVNMGTNLYRVLVLNSSTKVYANGKRLSNIVNGKYYEFQNDQPIEIYATSPVAVAQYITSGGQCGNTQNGGNGNPSMIYLASHSISSATIVSPQYSAIVSQYVNVVVRSIAIDSFSLDKKNMRPYFKTFPGDTALSYAQIPLTQGEHYLHTDTLSFYATAYGYGPAESYGYNAGFYIDKLSNLTVKNPYSDPVLQEVCKTVPFRIYFTVIRKATNLNFNFGNNKFLSPNNIVDIANPVADSVYYDGTDSVCRYHLPATYTYAQQPDSTSFTVNVTLDIITDEGCIEERTVSDIINVLPKPYAYISLNYSNCGQDTLDFRDSSLVSTGNFVQWIWNFGDGTTSTEQNPVKEYKSFGNYDVLFRSITDVGCYGDTSKSISLNPLPTANFGYSGLYCPLSNITFTDSSTIQPAWQITKLAWYFGDGTTSADSSPIKQYNAGGTYDVKLIAYSNKNCIDSSIKAITIYAADSFKQFITVKNTYAFTDTVCSTQPFRLAVTFTERQAQIHWSFLGNTNLSPDNNVDLLSAAPDSLYFNGQDSFFRYSLPAGYSYAATGLFNIQITTFILTKGGCLAQTVFNDTVRVVEKPVANWGLNYDSCSNDTIYFADQSSSPGSNIVSWQWSFGDGTTSIEQNPVKKYATYGDYPVSLYIVTNIGCFADTVKPVSLNPAPVAAFGIYGTLFCPNSPLNFGDSSVIASPGKIASWLWSFGDGGSSTQQNPSTQYGTAGDYIVSLTVYSDHNCPDTLTKTVTIYNTPAIALPQDVYIFSGVPYQITPVYTGTGLTFMWAPPDGLNSDTAAYPITTTEKNITYQVSVVDSGGCQAVALVNIHVEKLIEVPNVFSPNGDGINDKWILTNIEGYPNCTVRVFNRYGQLVFSSTGYTTPWDGTLNGNPLPVGTYYYIIDTKNPAVFLVKQAM